MLDLEAMLASPIVHKYLPKGRKPTKEDFEKAAKENKYIGLPAFLAKQHGWSYEEVLLYCLLALADGHNKAIEEASLMYEELERIQGNKSEYPATPSNPVG